MIGQSIAHYRITAKLGEGGMGEVYRAVDTKLDREVALKILPANLAQDSGRMARFEREAKVLASLNHPNIAAIYGVEERALVMELVEGASPKGPMPFDDAWKIASQIAAALEYAHDKGIVHRDLKPDNIKITPDGVVKLLDFGLAKAFTEQKEPTANPEHSPTLTIGATEVGVILGTAAYMAPEQAKGKSVDKRADIWSFGVVLYELLTGERLFKGEDVSETLVSVLRDEPDFAKVPVKTRRLLRSCLEKDPKQRLRDIGDARELLEGGQETAVAWRKWPWIAAAALGVIAVVGLIGWWQATRAPVLRPLMSLNLDLPDDMPLVRVNNGGMLAISNDGTRLALTLRDGDGKVRLHTRTLRQNAVTSLAGTDNASYPFFSPDGQWIGFFADGKLKKIPSDGGAPMTLCDAPGGRGASWGDDGSIVAALSEDGGLFRVSSGGGTPVALTTLRSGERTHRQPYVLPGSRAALFTASASTSRPDIATIDAVSFGNGERKTLQRSGFAPGYLAAAGGAGRLLYMRENALFAVPFDAGGLAVTGAPVPVLEEVSISGTGVGDFSFSASGDFIYLVGRGQRAGRISSIDRTGVIQPLQAPPGMYHTPRFSPDGKRLAFSSVAGDGDDVWVKDLERDTLTRVSFLAGENRWAIWTPDGRYLAFRSLNVGAPGIYWTRSDGSGEAQRLTERNVQETPYSFSPDGKRLAFHQIGSGGSVDIFTAEIEGDRAHPKLGNPELFLRTSFNKVYPAISPDGRWLAYSSNQSGVLELYVRPFTSSGGQWQISTGGGMHPVWSKAARELLFQSSDHRVMVASYSVQGDTLVPGKPRPWSETRLLDLGGIANFDLSPDGKRLAAVLPADGGGERPLTRLTVFLNFSDELQRRVQAGGK
ncbi:MAG TPA: protein kinase [Bryobacteraceae bacterium]|nr:protein kinase [Bryobacteraceae bacterium]